MCGTFYDGVCVCVGGSVVCMWTNGEPDVSSVYPHASVGQPWGTLGTGSRTYPLGYRELVSGCGSFVHVYVEQRVATWQGIISFNFPLAVFKKTTRKMLWLSLNNDLKKQK